MKSQKGEEHVPYQPQATRGQPFSWRLTPLVPSDPTQVTPRFLLNQAHSWYSLLLDLCHMLSDYQDPVGADGDDSEMDSSS